MPTALSESKDQSGRSIEARHERIENDAHVNQAQRIGGNRDSWAEQQADARVVSTGSHHTGILNAEGPGQELPQNLASERVRIEEKESSESVRIEKESSLAERSDPERKLEIVKGGQSSSKEVTQKTALPSSFQVPAPASSSWSVKELLVRAQEEDVDAMFNLGVCYEEGRGVEANPMLACWWYSKVRPVRRMRGVTRSRRRSWEVRM